MIYLTSFHLQQISAHVEAAYPEEGCGLLVGLGTADRRQVEAIVPTENVWTPDFLQSDDEFEKTSNPRLSKLNRFAIHPKVMLQVQRESRDRHQQILGIFHSHPDAPAVPSEFDRAIAWPEYVYLILRVDGGKVKEIAGWQLDGRGQFQGVSAIVDRDTDGERPS